MTIAAVAVVVMQWDHGVREWALPATGLLLIGFLLQYLGHAHEGNDMGEIILIKRLLRRPYTSISPRYADKRQSV